MTRSEKNVSNLIEQVGEIKSLLNEKNNKEANEVVNDENKDVKSIPSKSKTYAEKMKIRNNESVVLLKPKNTQNSNATECDLKKVIDPTKFNINSLRKFPKGGLAIECKDVSESTLVEKMVSEKMGDNYVVSLPELKNPKVKIIGIEQEVSEQELLHALQSQNNFLASCNMKVINLFKTKRNNHTAIVELDSTSFEKCMNAGKVKIMWSRCSVIEDLNVFRCFKCNGYNHKQSNCTNNQACKRCALSHNHGECNAKNESCINCKIANSKFNLNLNTRHAATNEKCPIYQRKVEAERRKIKYSI